MANKNKNIQNALFILQADFDSLKKKGVTAMIKERKEGGFFSRAITFHPMALVTRVINYGPGLPIHELRMPEFNGYRVWRWLLFLVHLARCVVYARAIIKQEHVSLVRAQDPYFSGLIGYLATRFSGIPFAISIHSDYEQRHLLDANHGSPKIFGSRNLALKLEKFLLRRADLVMAVRESLRQQAILHGATAPRTTVFPHVVDFDLIDQLEPQLPENIEKFADGRKILLFAGRLNLENYVWDVIEAARRMNIRSDCAFVLAGPGKELETVREVCSREPLLKRMLFACGPLDRTTIYAAQKSAYIGIVLMGGFSLIEFCAARRACVTYDVEWHSELIEDEKTGVLLQEGDIDGLVSALCRLLENQSLVEEFGAKAYERARQNHNISAVMAHRVNAYKRLLSKS